MWARMMMICFLTNGLCAFGLRIMTGMGLIETYKLPYILLWYAAGLVLAAAILLRGRNLATRTELGVGIGLALCSVGGQLGMASALEYGVPGYVVYQVAPCGGLLFVVLAGVLFFKERVTAYGICGIALGLVALALLSYG
jgi:multidrug transporter EmrE-like cation transporter